MKQGSVNLNELPSFGTPENPKIMSIFQLAEASQYSYIHNLRALQAHDPKVWRHIPFGYEARDGRGTRARLRRVPVLGFTTLRIVSPEGSRWIGFDHKFTKALGALYKEVRGSVRQGASL